ncbi:alpha-L-fucosidase-like [Belonocnema kinseyi]|uniref:alpha-L-fucosidase-like n=1 Tax=Belonocnema kinseyi TaxID=2817044 RepID=UPI00143D1F00|nr:alpha-L-fucosidase-like [Belonocnema kinseyi]XP_033222212.1 alpha-L-fucosidase-like [Belonocnema kinseyi]XP_033222213.1 alpha-L-fucosidase-like [Belonocnema kinseyi]
MNLHIPIVLFALLICNIFANQVPEFSKKFEPTWDSLDKRPLPSWYDEAKFGIFIHWGVFSVPSFGSEWFWINWKGQDQKYSEFMKKRYPPNFTYQDFARDFTAEFFNATQWSEIFQASGAKYIVLTSKHHEGYTLWPSKYSFSWNAVDVGPQRDIIGELAKAIRSKTNLTFGLYHSLYEWFNPLYLEDKNNNFTTNSFVTQKIIPELNELVDLYKPEVIWSDGDWEATDNYWESKEFLSWLYNYSPVKETVVVNDRWGINIPCHHGDFYTCKDRYNPAVLQPHKWENAMTIDRKSWGFRRNADLKDYMSVQELIRELVVTVSCNGNLLMNVGPTKDGIIIPIFEERLRGMGAWLAVNGEAIYKTKPWNVQNDTLSGDVWYTQSKDGKKLYAILLSWSKNNLLGLAAVKIPALTQINLLGYPYELTWEQRSTYLLIDLPVEAHKGQPAWVVVIHQHF